jgi:hypothetical protein
MGAILPTSAANASASGVAVDASPWVQATSVGLFLHGIGRIFDSERLGCRVTDDLIGAAMEYLLKLTVYEFLR